MHFKPKQVRCLEATFNGRGTVAILPTGYGKSLIYHLPDLLRFRNNSKPDSSVVIVVSPLNSLIDDQIRKIHSSPDLKAVVLKVKHEGLKIDHSEETIGHDKLLMQAKYDFVFTHPETCLSSKGCILLQTEPYQSSVQAIVIDEAHCVLEWLVIKYYLFR